MNVSCCVICNFYESFLFHLPIMMDVVPTENMQFLSLRDGGIWLAVYLVSPEITCHDH